MATHYTTVINYCLDYVILIDLTIEPFNPGLTAADNRVTGSGEHYDYNHGETVHISLDPYVVVRLRGKISMFPLELPGLSMTLSNAESQ